MVCLKQYKHTIGKTTVLSMASNKSIKVECEACGAAVHFRQLDRHKQRSCCKKVVCGVCDLELPYLHLKNHEAEHAIDVSKTVECEACSATVNLQKIERHNLDNPIKTIFKTLQPFAK